MIAKNTLSLDDILLEPQYSEIETRKEVDISCHLHEKCKLRVPIIASCMDTVTGEDMAVEMSRFGGSSIIHRYNSIEEQSAMVAGIMSEDPATKMIGAVGMTDDYLERAQSLVANGVIGICVDVAHGHHALMKQALYRLRKYLPARTFILAGNVATGEGFKNLIDWGADAVRVGIANGSACSTSLQTGHSVPTVSSILDCFRTRERYHMFIGHGKIVLDGGMKNAGDIVKALALGADCIMTGSLLAATDKTPGSIVKKNKKLYKYYAGMSSGQAQERWGKKQSTPEGIETLVLYKGKTIDILKNLEGGLRSGLSYSGARNIDELQLKAKFLKRTSLGFMEGGTHILNQTKL